VTFEPFGFHHAALTQKTAELSKAAHRCAEIVASRAVRC
jgi:hypothetical protein